MSLSGKLQLSRKVIRGCARSGAEGSGHATVPEDDDAAALSATGMLLAACQGAPISALA